MLITSRTRDVPVGEPYPSPIRAGYVILLLSLASVISYVDGQIFALLVTPIKVTFALSDARVGWLQSVLLLSVGLSSFPIGLVIDRGSRIRILLTCITVWSGFTALSALCTSFWPLFVCRMGLGAAESAVWPAAYSLIADLYPTKIRTTVTFFLYGLVLIGSSLSTVLTADMIGVLEVHKDTLPRYLANIEYWRLSFLAVAALGFALALLFLPIREPLRRTDHEAIAARDRTSSFFDYLRFNWFTLLRIYGSLLTSWLGVIILSFWMPTILFRAYGDSIARAGELTGLTFGVGSVLGVIASAILTQVLRRRFEATVQLQVLKIGAAAVAVGLPLMLLARSENQLLGLFLVQSLFAYIAFSAGPGLLISMGPNRLRGRIFATFTVLSVIANTLWPPLVGMLSDGAFKGQSGLYLACCAVGVPCGLLAPLLLIGIDRPFRRLLALKGLE